MSRRRPRIECRYCGDEAPDPPGLCQSCQLSGPPPSPEEIAAECRKIQEEGGEGWKRSRIQYPGPEPWTVPQVKRPPAMLSTLSLERGDLE